MTPRQRVECVLKGGRADRIPFTVYERKLPPCTAERELRNRGLCIVNRGVPVVRTHQPNVKVTTTQFSEQGRNWIRTVYETPVGSVSTLQEPAGFTSWMHERMYKRPEDFKVIRFLIDDQRFEPCYETFARAQEREGEDVILRAGFGLEPLQCLISGAYLGMETFCIEWMDHRDELLGLYGSIVEKQRELYPLVAASPCLHANYGGNVVPAVIGVENFRTYYLPHYQEAAEIMHRHGKLIGCHFDGPCGPIRSAIAETPLDYIEAFTPAPDTDMTLAEARAAWPGKVLWINFPSSLHLRSDAEVEAATVGLLDELGGDPDGFIMGVTEDVPEDRWRDSFRAIMNGLDRPRLAAPGSAKLAP